MPDFPIVRNVDPIVLSPLNPQSLGSMMNAMGLAFPNPTAWITANKAFFIPISIAGPVTVKKMFWFNGTVSGNVDVGIYDRGGNRLVSAGSTAQAGASAVQEVDITDLLLKAGLYYLAMVMDNTTGQVELLNLSTGPAMFAGVAEMTSAFPLPATATFAAVSSARTPFVAATLRTVV